MHRVSPAPPLPFRQIHLDFHTSEEIPNVAAEFDPDAFARMLEEARVASVTCFARCHHGYLYFDSARNPERIHPHLCRRNLLKEMVDACHSRGIRVPIYTTVQWDRYSWDHRPEWRVQRHDGKGEAPLEPGFYGTLDVGHEEYRRFLFDHVQDIFECIGDVDGIFLDILWAHEAEDCSLRSRLRMEALGLNPCTPDDRRKFGQHNVSSFVSEMSDHIRKMNPRASVYYNNGSLAPNNREHAKWYSHLEFDALPGANPTGYHHLPHRARFERNIHTCVGQTGRFHTGWGDFGSYKHPVSLEFECFHLLALNIRCLIGDQLHPSGRMDREVYRLIGSVYSQVEEVEPWCVEACPVVDIGVLDGPYEETRTIVRMLQEEGHQFDVVDDDSDYSKYAVLILTDSARLSAGLAEKIHAFLEQGGRVLASFEAGLDSAGERFVLSEWGVTKAGDGPTLQDGRLARGDVGDARHSYATYFRPRDVFECGRPSVDFGMYVHHLPVARVTGDILADAVSPYFFRSANRYCSHMHSPSSGEITGPAVVANRKVVYFAHPIWRIYSEFSPAWVKSFAAAALRRLLPEPVVMHDGPSSVIVTVNNQEASARWVIHLLQYIPERRANRLEIVEDRIPLHNLGLSVREDQRVEKITLEPTGEEIPFERHGGRLHFTVPRIDGHQLVALHRSTAQPGEPKGDTKKGHNE